MDESAREEAFVAELTAHQAALHAYLSSLMPGDSSVDDVLQKTNLTLWRKQADFEIGTNFRAWAFECAKWTTRAYLKEKKRKSWLVFDDELTDRVTERMSSMLPVSTPAASHTALRQCLERLRSSDRELLLSHYEGEQSLAECASRMGRTAGSLKVALFRLRAALRRCISDRLVNESL